MNPLLLQAALGALRGLGRGGPMRALAGVVGGGMPRRRRRRGIPKRVINDVAQIKAILGPKAASEALHILLSRG